MLENQSTFSKVIVAVNSVLTEVCSYNNHIFSCYSGKKYITYSLSNI